MKKQTALYVALVAVALALLVKFSPSVPYYAYNDAESGED